MELGQEMPRTGDARADGGYAMAALLVGLSIMAILMSMALPVWSHFAKREREEELIWRGQQYARAVGLFQRKYANTFPPTIDILVEQKFLRKKYKDPITNDDFQPIPAGGGLPGQIQDPRAREQQGGPPPPTTPQGAPPPTTFTFQAGPRGGPTTVGGSAVRQPAIGIQGVVSKSKESSIKMYNGRTRYNEWAFVHVVTAQAIGPGGTQRPGVPPGSQPAPGGFQRGGTSFTPLGGVDRRPGIGNMPTGFGPRPAMPPPGQPSPFGTPSGQPPSGFGPASPFNPPSPFGAPGQPPRPPRPPGT